MRQLFQQLCPQLMIRIFGPVDGIVHMRLVNGQREIAQPNFPIQLRCFPQEKRIQLWYFPVYPVLNLLCKGLAVVIPSAAVLCFQAAPGCFFAFAFPGFLSLRPSPFPLPGLLHEPVVLLYNAFSPVRLMLQHGPGFRVLSRDLFRQCPHFGHKLVDERHHLVHGLLEGIFIFRVFIGTGNKRPQRLRRGNGVIQRVRRQFLQRFLPAQLLAFGGLVLLLLLRYPAVQVVSFRAPQ